MQSHRGFTIVELLIVIIVISILAAVTVVAFNGVQSRAQISKINGDLKSLSTAIMKARISTGRVLTTITGDSWTAGSCVYNLPADTDPTTLDKSHVCWTRYYQTLDRISTASGVDVRELIDPWGRPYYIDENETASGACGSRDRIAVFTRPNNGGSNMNGQLVAFSRGEC